MVVMHKMYYFKHHGSIEGGYINGAPQGITLSGVDFRLRLCKSSKLVCSRLALKFHETDEYTLYPAPIISVNKISNIATTGTPYNLVGLVGSANISIELAPNNMLKVTIFNITSLTSGAFGKEAFGEEYYPKSYMRVPGKRTPYGNISQTFHLLIPNPNK
jgi:hypothetical protein